MLVCSCLNMFCMVWVLIGVYGIMLLGCFISILVSGSRVLCSFSCRLFSLFGLYLWVVVLVW